MAGYDITFYPGIRLNEHDLKDPLQLAIGDRTLSSTLLSEQLKYLIATGFSAEEGARENSKK